HREVRPNSRGPRMFVTEGTRVPVYGESVTFSPRGSGVLIDEETQQPAAYMKVRSNGPTVVRVGYDLFSETELLLTEGQRPENARIPALDLHVAFLRSLIVRNGVPLLEIPPVPEGYRFIACLTHDVDHPSMRQHKFDHTMLGFLYRAVAGSALALLRGR